MFGNSRTILASLEKLFSFCSYLSRRKVFQPFKICANTKSDNFEKSLF